MDRSSILRASTNSCRQVEKCLYLPFYYLQIPRRIELYAGRGRRENALATQAGTRFPNGSPGGKRIPESALRLGRSFRMMPQAETASRSLSSEWDSFSGWRAQRKLRPGICSETGTRFPADRPDPSTPKPARSPPQNWVEESQNATVGGRHDCRR